MKKYLFLFITIFTISFSLAKEVNNMPKIMFSGDEYHLAFQGEDVVSYLSEYTIKDETVDNWRTLITLAKWKGKRTVKEFYTGYMNLFRGSKHLLVEEPTTYLPDEDNLKNEVIIEFAVNGGDYTEWNFNKIFEVKNQLYSITFAVKLPVEEDVTKQAQLRAFDNIKMEWVKELFNLDIIPKQ